MSYIGHGLSHAIFGGAVVSFVMAWNFYVGAGAPEDLGILRWDEAGERWEELPTSADAGSGWLSAVSTICRMEAAWSRVP